MLTISSGALHIYVSVDNNFVSKSQIEHITPNDSFKTSLGTDSALHVTYPPVRTLNWTTNQSSFFSGKDSKQAVAAHSQCITVCNSHPSTVSALCILDHIPFSTNTWIKVNVLSPSGLGPTMDEGEALDASKNKDRLWMNIQKGVQARWVNLNVGGEGMVEWVCEMLPNEELELELSWEVNVLAGQKWQMV